MDFGPEPNLMPEPPAMDNQQPPMMPDENMGPDMGNNADFYNVREVFAALDGTLTKLGVPLKASMEKIFCDNMK